MTIRSEPVVLVVAVILGASCGGAAGGKDGAAGANPGTAGNSVGGSAGVGGGAAGSSGAAGMGGGLDAATARCSDDRATHTTGSFAAKLDGTPMRNPLVWNFVGATPSSGAGVSISNTGLPTFVIDVEHCEVGTFVESAGTRSGVSMTLYDSGMYWGCRFDVTGSSCTVDVTAWGVSSGEHIVGTFFGTLTPLLVSVTPPTRTISEGSFDLAIP